MPNPRIILRRLRVPAAFTLAAACAAMAVWSVLPPPIFLCVPMRIAATEAGAWLAIGAASAIALAAWPAADKRLRLATVTLAMLAAVFASLPWVLLMRTEERAELAMDGGLGSGWRERIPAARLAAMRPSPFSFADAIAGIATGEATVERGVLVAEPDGVPLRADVHRPPTGGGHPVIISIHGGGWHHGVVAEGETCHRYLAARGYVVVSIAYRFAPRFRFPAQLDDVRAAIAWVRAHAADFGGDASRLVLMGRSAGGQLALLAAYTDEVQPVRGVVGWYAPVDLIEGYRQPPRPDPLDVRALMCDYLGGTPDEQPEAYRAASPIAHVPGRRSPTLLITGTADHGVLVGFERQLIDRLRATATPAVLIEIPWAEHAFDAIPDGPGAQLALYHLERFLAWATEENGDEHSHPP